MPGSSASAGALDPWLAELAAALARRQGSGGPLLALELEQEAVNALAELALARAPLPGPVEVREPSIDLLPDGVRLSARVRGRGRGGLMELLKVVRLESRATIALEDLRVALEGQDARISFRVREPLELDSKVLDLALGLAGPRVRSGPIDPARLRRRGERVDLHLRGVLARLPPEFRLLLERVRLKDLQLRAGRLRIELALAE